MRALVFDDELKLSEVELMPIPPGEVRIKILLTGICNTDLEICKGYMGFKGVLGHEFVGVVSECAPDIPDESAKYWLGKRVVGEINCGCGHCALCLQGDTRHCAGRTTLGIDRRPGTMTAYCTLPLENLYGVPDNVTDVQAVFTEPLAAAWNIVEQVHIEPHSRVLILGDGKLGQLCGQVLHLSGCDLTVVGKHAEKLQILKDLGVQTQLLEDWLKDKERTPYDAVIEATGRAASLNLAIDAVRPRGTIVLKSTVADNTVVNFTKIVVNEITIVGSRCGRFAPALRSLAAGLIKVEPLISAVYPLERGVEAFNAARNGSLKVLLTIHPE